jgi:hypothetical protein
VPQLPERRERGLVAREGCDERPPDNDMPVMRRMAVSARLGTAPQVAEGEEADMARAFLQDFEAFQKHSELIDP